VTVGLATGASFARPCSARRDSSTAASRILDDRAKGRVAKIGQNAGASGSRILDGWVTKIGRGRGRRTSRILDGRVVLAAWLSGGREFGFGGYAGAVWASFGVWFGRVIVGEEDVDRCGAVNPVRGPARGRSLERAESANGFSRGSARPVSLGGMPRGVDESGLIDVPSMFPPREGVILPLYAARLDDLGPGDLVQLECVCGHSDLLTAAMLSTAGVKPSDKVVDLAPRLRCRECDARGKAVVSIKWASGSGRG